MSEFFDTPAGIAVLVASQCLAVIGFVMVSLLFLVYGERKFWAAVLM
ncbi:MAG: NADH-quinone oxidoreductase subunit H, partial [Paracoccaceae bacterium]